MEETGTTIQTTVNNGLLHTIGMGNVDIGILFLVLLVLVLILLVLLIVMIVKQKELKARYEKFMQGEVASSFEETVQTLIRDVDRLKRESKAYANDIDLLFQKHESAIQKAGLVRYDAFKEMGGNMSFCLALLDEKNNGFIMNCVHSSTGCYSYAKRIKDGKCDIDLSPEEQETIRRTIQAE